MAEYEYGGNASWDSPPERKPKSSKSLRNLFAPASKVAPVVEGRRLRRNSATGRSSRQRPSSQPDLKKLNEDPQRRARRGRRASLFGSMHERQPTHQPRRKTERTRRRGSFFGNKTSKDEELAMEIIADFANFED